MSTRNPILAGILVGLCLPVTASLALATEIHKWVDKEGITHYSEEPPANDQLPAQRVDLPDEYTAPHAKATDDDYYSVVNQASRLEASRLAREESRRRDRELDIQQEALEVQRTPVVVDTQQDERYYPVYYHGNRHDRFHGKRGHYDDDRRHDDRHGRGSRDGADRSKTGRHSGSTFKPSFYQGK